MEQLKFKPLKNTILKSSLSTSVAMITLVILILNVVFPQCFYATQKDMNKDISISVNDNISDIFSDINYVYKKVLDDDELIRNLVVNITSRKNADYSEFSKSYDYIVEKFADEAFYHKNIVSTILPVSDGEILVNAELASSEIESFIKNNKINKPIFVRIEKEASTASDEYLFVMPLYDKNGAYICNIMFLLNRNKNNLLANQTDFIIVEESGNLVVSNTDVTTDDFDVFSKISEDTEEYTNIETINGKKHFVTMSKLDAFSWRLFVLVPADGFYNGVRYATAASVVIFLLLGLGLYFYTTSFSQMIGFEISNTSTEINNFLNDEQSPGDERKTSRLFRGFQRKKGFNKKYLYYNVTALFIPMMIVMIMLNIYYIITIRTEYRNTAEILAEMNRYKAENIYERYNNAASYIILNEGIKSNLYEYENASEDIQMSELTLEAYKNISDELYSIRKYTGDFRFVCKDNYNNGILQWPEEQSGSYDTTVFEQGFSTMFDRQRGRNVCVITKNLQAGDYIKLKKTGYMSLQYDANELVRDIGVLNSNLRFEIISNEGDTIVTANEKFNLENDSFFSYDSSSHDFVLRMYYPKVIVNNTIHTILIISFVIMLILALSVLIISNHMAQYIITSVKAVKYSVDDESREYVIIGKKYRDEFDELNDAVTDMKQRISMLIEGTYQHEIDMKNLQMQALQMQITPHFLYNIFEVINAMIDLEDERVSRLVLLVSQFFRMGISKSAPISTLEDELRYSDVYLNIQKFVLDDKLTIEKEIEADCYNCRIIRFVIQPILENVFKHSSENDNRRISIKAYKVNNTVKIAIRDNGEGIDGERLAEIRKSLYGEASDGVGVGLRNINERLLLYYGEKYRLRIYSSEGKGTLTLIKVPYSTE